MEQCNYGRVRDNIIIAHTRQYGHPTYMSICMIAYNYKLRTTNRVQGCMHA